MELACRIGTPTNFVDGVVIVNLEEVGVTPVPPLPPPTQQSAKGALFHVPHYQQMHHQALFSPDAVLRPQQLPALTGATQALQRPVLQQPVAQLQVQEPVVAAHQPTSAQPAQLAKKKLRRSSDSFLSTEKTKSSLSDKRGSIVKSIDKLASSINTDEANNAASASSASLMPMMLMQMMQQQQEHRMELQMRGMEERLCRQMKKKERKEKKRRKKAWKRRKVAAAGGEKNLDDSSSSSSSSSST